MKKQLYHVDALRFLFSAIIVYFHVLHDNIMPFTGDVKLYSVLQEWSDEAGMIVECFLIMGGYFLYQSYRRAPDKPFSEFALDRFFRLWPVFAVNAVLSVIFLHESVYDAVFDLLFFRTTGISLVEKGIIWYVSPFFWCSLLIFALLKYLDPRKRTLILSVLVYFCYAVIINNMNGRMGRIIVYGFLSLGMCRAFAGIGLGVLLATALEKVHESFGERRSATVGSTAFCTVAEMGLLVFLLGYFLFGLETYQNSLIVVVAFSALFLCMLRGDGLLSRLINRPFLGFWGRFGYSIYVPQQFVFFLLKRTLWRQNAFVQGHAIWCLLLSTLLSVLFGIGMYYLVERPSVKLYQGWKRSWRERNVN